MKFLFSLIAILLLSSWIMAQGSSSFGLLSFTEPANWTFTDNGSYHTYSTVNKATNTFCIISIYRSEVSSGNIEQDFQQSWKGIVAGHFTIFKKLNPQQNITPRGIKYLQDEANVSNSQGNFVARLMVIDLKGKTQTVLFLSGGKNMLAQYQTDLDHFLGSVKSNNTVITNSGGNNNITITSAAASNKNGISVATTNFDDGCVATPKDDYILLTKNSYKVLLYYGEMFTDESRNNTLDYFYTHQLANEYTITNTAARNDNYQYYIEGEAMENITGKKCYLSMEIVAQNGVAKTVIAVSPAQAEHKMQFGTDLKNMLGYNRFGVALQDMAGTWKAGSGSSISYYSYSTGDYVGSNAVVMSDKFIFRSNGSFEAEFKGATGMVGAMKTYQQHYKGIVSVLSPWQFSTTDQDNKTVVYDCWFESVKGGVIFHLTNHQYTGNTYDMVKEINK